MKSIKQTDRDFVDRLLKRIYPDGISREELKAAGGTLEGKTTAGSELRMSASTPECNEADRHLAAGWDEIDLAAGQEEETLAAESADEDDED